MALAARLLLLVVGFVAYAAGTNSGGDDAEASKVAAPPSAAIVPSTTRAPAIAAATVTTEQAVTTLATTLPAPTLPAPGTAAPSTVEQRAVEPPPAATTPPNNSTLAQADLEDYFSLVRGKDYSSALQYFTPATAPSFAEFVDYWNVLVESFDARVDGCNVIGDSGVCIYRFNVLYSDLASETYRNKCFANVTELTMVRVGQRFAIDGQRTLEDLTC